MLKEQAPLDKKRGTENLKVLAEKNKHRLQDITGKEEAVQYPWCESGYFPF